MDSPKPSVISPTPDVLGGTRVFAGTRVPIQTLIDYLEGGETIDEFLEGFPTVAREQVLTLSASMISSDDLHAWYLREPLAIKSTSQHIDTSSCHDQPETIHLFVWVDDAADAGQSKRTKEGEWHPKLIHSRFHARHPNLKLEKRAYLFGLGNTRPPKALSAFTAQSTPTPSI